MATPGPDAGLFVTDLDGTLLRPDETLSPYTLGVLRRVRERGLALTYCTSRSWFAARRLTAGAGFALPAVVGNGAFAVDPRTGAVLRSNLLARGLAESILADAAARAWFPFVFGTSGAEEVVLYREPPNAGQAMWIDHRRRRGDGRLRGGPTLRVPATVYEIAFLEERPAAAAVAAWVAGRYGGLVSVSRMPERGCPGYDLVQLTHPAANKGAMLRWLAARLGVRPQRVTVFGDNRNDLPMFAVAGHRIAVADAEPEVLAAADEVVAACADDGVARYLAGRLDALSGGGA